MHHPADRAEPNDADRAVPLVDDGQVVEASCDHRPSRFLRRRIGGHGEASMKFAAMLLELSVKPCLTFIELRRKSLGHVFE